MNRHTIALNIDGLGVEVSSTGDVAEAFSKLQNDFSSYIVERSVSPYLKIEVFDKPLESSNLEGLKFQKVFRRCETVEVGAVRYNKYDESTYVKFDYQKERAEVFTPRPADQHELCYLIILSRVGKKLDQMGRHRIHAFAGVYQERAFVLSMDMGQGKSTLAFEMLRQHKIRLLSDDAPYFDELGRLCPFHLRIGVSHSMHVEELVRLGKPTYLAERRNYPDKQLLSLAKLDKGQLEDCPHEEFVLIFGRRTAGPEVHVKKCSKIKTFFLLLRPMIVGVGLPILAEYFWGFGPRDFFLKTRIALSRAKRAALLAKSKKSYWVEFGDSLEDNMRAVFEALER